MAIHIRKKKLSNGEFSIYLDIYHKGTRKYEFTGLRITKDRANNKQVLQQAESIKSKRLLELNANDYNLDLTYKKKADFSQFYKDNIDRYHKRFSQEYYSLKRFIDFVGKPIEIGAIDEKLLEDYKAHLLENVTQNTANRFFSLIRRCLEKAVNQGIIKTNPARRVKPIKKVEVEINYLTLDELNLLAKTPLQNKDLKRAFLFGAYTGLRFSDIQNLKWEQIREGRLYFKQQKTKAFEYMDLNKQAVDLIKKGDNSSDFVFNKLPTGGERSRAIKRWVKRAGLTKRITFHSSRHTFATMLLTYGTDLYTVSKLLGHRDYKTTEIYAKVIDEKKKQAINTLPEIEFEL